MSHTSESLVAICDDLLRAISAGRKLDAPEASKLIDRVLDIRNRISPPKPQPPKPTNQPK